MCPIQDERLRRLERPATWPPKRLALQLPATTTLMPVRRHAAAVSCPKAAKTLSSPFTTFITDSYAPRAVIAGMNECLKLGGARCCPVLIYVPRLGSGLIGHSQKMTVAASATAEKKTVGQRS